MTISFHAGFHPYRTILALTKCITALAMLSYGMGYYLCMILILFLVVDKLTDSIGLVELQKPLRIIGFCCFGYTTDRPVFVSATIIPFKKKPVGLDVYYVACIKRAVVD